MTVKEILAGIDIERRAGFRMKGTESDELGAVRGGPGDPILLPQIIEQRKALFQFFDVLAHDAVLPLEAERRRLLPAFPGKDGGWRNFLRAARAREFAKPESARTKAQLGDQRDRRAPASEPCGRAFGGERKVPVGSGPGRGPSGEV
jgi:hypothetical protein